MRSLGLWCFAILPIWFSAAVTFANEEPSSGDAEADAGALPRRPSLFELDPQKPDLTPPATPEGMARERLRKIEDVEEEEFTAPPLVVARISTLPVAVGDSSTQALYRAERNLIRERARIADRMFRRGDYEGALSIMTETDRLLKTTELRIMALNRVAAYHFRLNQFDEGAAFARAAWELDSTDAISASNLAAILLMAGRVDEALDILLRIYRQAFDRPQLAFSVHFNLACAYSLKGEEIPAIQNLALAAQIDPFATYAAFGDTHLDPIRQNRDFIRIREAIENLMKTTAPARAP